MAAVSRASCTLKIRFRRNRPIEMVGRQGARNAKAKTAKKAER